MALILKRSYVKESYNLRRRENYVQIGKKKKKEAKTETKK